MGEQNSALSRILQLQMIKQAVVQHNISCVLCGLGEGPTEPPPRECVYIPLSMMVSGETQERGTHCFHTIELLQVSGN